VRLDQTGWGSVAATQGSRPIADYTSVYYRDEDSYGQSNWAYVHARIGQFGIVARHIYGTGSGTMTALPGKSYLEQLTDLDVRDNNIANGDVTLSSSRGSNPGIDLGKARFKRETYALTYNPFARLSFALGVETLKTRDRNGEPTRVNDLDSVPTFNTTTTTLTSQVDSLLAAQGSGLTANDLGGQNRQQKQVFSPRRLRILR
jgi:hypothetical protein